MDTEQSSNKTNPWVWVAVALGGLFTLACICLAAVVLVGGIFGISTGIFTSQAGPVAVTAVVQPQPGPTIPHGYDPTRLPTPEPDPSVTPSFSTSDEAPPETGMAVGAELPARDRYDLAQRFLGAPENIPTPEPVVYEVGDVESFWVSNDDTERTVEVQAELAYLNERVYMWVEQGVRYNLADLERSADRFSEETYPINVDYFGGVWSPEGIDNDPRLHILHSTQLGGGVAGYFYSPSEYPASIVPYSNEKEIFFINIGNTPPGNDYYDAVLAHEFQHMIHWQVDKNEESWMNEGMSEVAAFLNGFGPSDFAPAFLMNPDLQLTDWPEGGGAFASYGGGFLFNAYFLDRFGQDALRALVADPLNGLHSVDETLAALGEDVTADEVFTDWTVANLLNDPDAADSRYGYPSIPDLMSVGVETTVESIPYAAGWLPVHQYGTDYITLDVAGTVTVTFEGAQQVQVIPANTANTDADPATDDRFVWWSNRGDESNMRLAREIDLSGVDDAALSYDVWYSIEELWDYGYVTVSADGGETWEILATPHTTTDDPHGNSYGPGYTGASVEQLGASPEGWLHEEIDLSGYAGQEILIGFEMLTDDAVNLPGMAVDNICVDAIDWCDDVEAGMDGWEPEGFARINNVLRQAFSVQVVVPGADGTVEVLPVTLDETNRGELTFTVEDGRPATLVISGLTRYTTEPALYNFTVTPGGS